MFAPNISTHWKSFAARFVFPTALTIVLFIISIFSFIIPAIEKSSLDRKREMIRELTNSAWNILAKLEHDEQMKMLTRAQAQAQAIDQIRTLHYGQEMKDYFWINDMHPRMVIHPYRTDLNGRDLSDYTDPDGKRVFVAFVDIVRKQGAGFVTYRWQWKDNPERILPKLSYVKGFSPWGWIIGTGIYIDDVNAEIAALTRHLIVISLVILFVISLLLASIIRQSYTTLLQQQLAEQALRESEEKYRTLVESAGEGMLMAFGGTYMHANQTLAELLGYDKNAFSGMRIGEIFAEPYSPSGQTFIQELTEGKPLAATFETRLRTRTGGIRDVILSTTPIEIGGKSGFIAVVTDITERKEAEDALGESEAKFRSLANNLNVGIFRRTVGATPRFVEVNPAMIKLLGYNDKEELMAVPLISLFCNPEDRRALEPKAQHEELKREIVRLKKKDGTTFVASIWGVLATADKGLPPHFDGIMEDITDIRRQEEEQRQLLSEMQTALLFFNQALECLPPAAVTSCTPETSIDEAVRRMDLQATGVLLVRDAAGRDCGVVTDQDLRKALKAHRPQGGVAAIMSSPVISLPGRASLFECWLLMRQKGISHLFVTDNRGAMTGVIGSDAIVALQQYSPAVLLREIENAQTPVEVIRHNTIRPHLITTLITCGAKPRNINHLNTIVVDAILNRLIEFAIQELGTPPVSFAFIVFGSEGRQEQTLRTDQDNAIVFEDVDAQSLGPVQEYFLALGTRVCGWLNQAGYAYCNGNNMAQNPQWCQPLTAWMRYFSEWVHMASGEDLLNAKIFFDFRCAYGQRNLVEQLWDSLSAILTHTPRFFHLLARNVLPLSPPIGLFGQFVVESVGDRGKALDLKSAMMPIVDYARIYALQHRIRATNTLERLSGLRDRNVLSQQNYQEMVQAYSYLMQIRLQAQADTMLRGDAAPDNYVSPKRLTYIEQKLLKEIFSQIKHFQARLSYDFTGQLGSA